MADYLLGMNAKLYRGAVTTADAAFVGYAALSELTNVRDVTLNLTGAEADITSRANSGWKAIASALREMSVDFDMIWKPGDAGFNAIRDTFLDSTKVIELAVLDQIKTTSGAQGPQGYFVITAFNRGEPIADAITVSVTAKLAKYNSWITV